MGDVRAAGIGVGRADVPVPTELMKVMRSQRSTYLSLCEWARAVEKEDEMERLEAEMARLDVTERWRVYANQTIEGGSRSVSDVLWDGDLAKARIRYALVYFDEHGFRRSKHQRRFHNAFIGSCLRIIYRRDFYQKIAQILESGEFTEEEIRQEVLICTPRRFGKTFSIALFVAAVLWALPQFEISIFSTGRRASQKLLALIHNFLTKLPGGPEMVIKYNVETMWLRGPGGSHDIRVVNSYPSKVTIE